MGNKTIGRCKLCDQDYCMECSTHEEWKEFCSDSCAKEFKEQETK